MDVHLIRKRRTPKATLTLWMDRIDSNDSYRPPTTSSPSQWLRKMPISTLAKQKQSCAPKVEADLHSGKQQQESRCTMYTILEVPRHRGYGSLLDPVTIVMKSMGHRHPRLFVAS